MKKCKLSVIIPSYNMASTLRETIDSILSQSFNDFELIIVDDGSTDNTKTVIAEYLKGGVKEDSRVSYIFQKNQGRSGALNTGIRKSKGEYITFSDADDILTDDSLKKRIKALDKNPHIGMVYADVYYTDRCGNVYKYRKSRRFQNKRLLLNDLFSNPTTPIIGTTDMVKREVFNKVGGYKTVYRRNQNEEMHIRILSSFDALYLPIPALFYRTYLRRSKILKYKLDGIRSWYLILDTYINNRPFRFFLKIKRTFFELLKLFYGFLYYKK